MILSDGLKVSVMSERNKGAFIGLVATSSTVKDSSVPTIFLFSSGSKLAGFFPFRSQLFKACSSSCTQFSLDGPDSSEDETDVIMRVFFTSKTGVGN